MFKKLKDKLAEEVKSSPQRIQQFAQAAQAAVTSASSSISDITNSDLFSIGDNDPQNPRGSKLSPSPINQPNANEDSSRRQAMDSTEYPSGHDIIENQRQRRLSNSSFASDISFRLPSYETPSMYHLQSDMEVSASEAEERGFSSSNVSLERVTKEQLYAAYRRTQERYTKYRTQYGDLARHYKLLEKDNSKARSVLVETQDKALRRISELREQCALEQSAKAHLEKSLRIEIEERNMKIDALNTKIKALQDHPDLNQTDNINAVEKQSVDDCVPLINLSNESEFKPQSDKYSMTEVTNLNSKIEKMEQLINKYKESLKASKDKNVQILSELQKVSNEIEHKNKEIDNLKDASQQLSEANIKMQELTNKNEDLQNQINGYDFAKTKEVSTMEIDLLRAKDEIKALQSKVAVFSKREEEYAISLAENKLSIHKELENKEAEIKSLKDSLSASKKEIQSLNIVIEDYKSSLKSLEDEQTKLNSANNELNIAKSQITDLISTLQEITKKHVQLEHTKCKLDEDYKCLELQIKQETAEKLAMVDRNVYLENRNTQLSEENAKKSSHISTLESELLALKKNEKIENIESNEKDEILKELNAWKSKYENLESEIREERIELVMLQSEIEKLIVNHEIIQSQNTEFHDVIADLKNENDMLQEQVLHYNEIKKTCKKLAREVNELQQFVKLTSDEANILQKSNYDTLLSFNQQINEALNQFIHREVKLMTAKHNELSLINTSLQNELLITSEEHAAALSKIGKIQEENEILKSTYQNFNLEKGSLVEQINSLSKKYEETVQYLEDDKLVKENLGSRMKDLEKEANDLQCALELEQSKQLGLMEQIKSLEAEKTHLLQTINSINEENDSLKLQLKNVKADHDKHFKELVESNNKINYKLAEKTNELSNKTILINNLEDKVRSLTEENMSLEKQAQNISGNVKDLESEIHDVRVSHAAIEIEKDRLNRIIEKLENNEIITTEQKTKDTQTEIDMTKNVIINEDIATLEVSEQNYLVSNQNIQLTSQSETRNSMYENEFSHKYVSLKNDYDILREENRRLQSDIEGLQAYLSKISKENSILNDKLRELFASSEHTTENDNTYNLKDLKNEIQACNEKIENLLRENTLLVEENLELKDQLQAQNYIKSNDIQITTNNENKVDTNDFKEKYINLLQINGQLEQRLLDSEHINKSVNTNMQQVQEKNDKLRSTNEKLERRLDEALISLRHLHSLQENTELEYLRNILYEYLTGSGTHSVTLAKVLSAIVKFDDMQTQLVLQKEKERQGLLRQLGII